MDDKAFAAQALDHGFISVAKLGECKLILNQQQKLGRKVTLQELLLEKGYITFEQAMEIRTGLPPAPKPVETPLPKPQSKDTFRRVMEAFQNSEKPPDSTDTVYVYVPER